LDRNWTCDRIEALQNLTNSSTHTTSIPNLGSTRMQGLLQQRRPSIYLSSGALLLNELYYLLATV
jgi:hypothetical protein